MFPLELIEGFVGRCCIATGLNWVCGRKRVYHNKHAQTVQVTHNAYTTQIHTHKISPMFLSIVFKHTHIHSLTLIHTYTQQQQQQQQQHHVPMITLPSFQFGVSHSGLPQRVSMRCRQTCLGQQSGQRHWQHSQCGPACCVRV